MKTAILALQGDFEEHSKALKRNIPVCETVYIKTVKDLKKHSDAKLLIIPGGESSTFSYLIDLGGIRNELTDFLRNKQLTVFTTCAGTILLSKKIINPGKTINIGLVDIVTERNGYGRQIDSFITKADFPDDSYLGMKLKNNSDIQTEMVFIRAPKIIELNNKEIEIIAYENKNPTLIRQGRFLCATFHPELSERSFVYDILHKMML